MGIVDTIWVLIVSTIPGLNVPILIIVFRGGRVDLGTSSQVMIFSARYSLNFRPISIVESKPSVPDQEREGKQWIEDKNRF